MQTRVNATELRATLVYLGVWIVLGCVTCGCTVSGNNSNAHVNSTVFRW